MMTTPAQAGTRPSDIAAMHEAPEIEFMAFQPVVEIIEKMTTRTFPQYPKE